MKKKIRRRGKRRRKRSVTMVERGSEGGRIKGQTYNALGANEPVPRRMEVNMNFLTQTDTMHYQNMNVP